MKYYPKVSICIPTYNRCEYLKQAIKSALDQDYPNIEVIVSDNASTDETINVVEKFYDDKRFFFHRNDINIGMVSNWRTLLYKYVTGDWFIILSDDDYLVDPKYISKAVDLSKKDSTINMIYANGFILYTDSNKIKNLNIPYSEVEDGLNIFLKKQNVMPQEYTLCNIIFKSIITKELQSFSNLNNVCCDMELFLKLCLIGKVGVVKDFVSVYRYHDSNLINKKRSYSELIAVTDIYIEPYKAAKVSGKIDRNELLKWKKKVFDPAMKDIIFCLSADCGDDFEKGMKFLCSKSGENLNQYYFDPFFTIKILSTKNKLIYRMLRAFKMKMGKKA